MSLYREGVGLVLIHDDGEVWVGRRYDTGPLGESSSCWQWPQGGIEQGETPEEALHREMREEIGTHDFHILRQTEWIAYDFPKAIQPLVYQGQYKGQQHLWFAARLNSSDDVIHIQTPHPEFSSWRWMAPQAVVNQAIPFKKDAYQKVYEHFKDLISP